MTAPADTRSTATAVEQQTLRTERAEFDEERETSLLSILALLLRERTIIVGAMALALVAALGVVLLKTRTYTTSFSFVPQVSQDQSRAGLASLAGQLGVSIGAAGGGTQSPQLYADLLRTRETLEPIIRDSVPLGAGRGRVALPAFLRVTGARQEVVMEQTLKALRDRISSNVAIRTTGMVSVAVSTPEPSVSLEIATRLLRGVNDFNLKTRRSQAGEERRFTQARLVEARQSLRDAEDVLQAFLISNRQYSNSPQLEFQRTRLERDVGLHQQVVSGLAQSFEEARIREVRDTPVISVIERPTMAALPDPRGGLVIVTIGAGIGLLLGILGALLRDTLRRFRQSEDDPDVSRLVTEWHQFRGRDRG